MKGRRDPGSLEDGRRGMEGGRPDPRMFVGAAGVPNTELVHELSSGHSSPVSNSAPFSFFSFVPQPGRQAAERNHCSHFADGGMESLDSDLTVGRHPVASLAKDRGI